MILRHKYLVPFIPLQDPRTFDGERFSDGNSGGSLNFDFDKSVAPPKSRFNEQYRVDQRSFKTTKTLSSFSQKAKKLSHASRNSLSTRAAVVCLIDHFMVISMFSNIFKRLARAC
jgi:hypothetical protein